MIEQKRFVSSRERLCWSLWLFLSFFVSIALSSVPPSNEPLLARECPSYGCVNYPRDVSFDDNARKALGNLIHKEENVENLESALRELEFCGDTDKATMTMIGYKGGDVEDQINQDRAFVLSPFKLNVDIPNTRILGVFDGHSDKGELVSEYAVQEVPRRLSIKLEAALNKTVLDDPQMMDEAVKRSLIDTFVEIDQE